MPDSSNFTSEQIVQLATFLITLGVTTVEAVRDALRKDGHDDETLDAIMAGVQTRLARHA